MEEFARNLATLCATILDAIETAERSDSSPQRTPWELRCASPPLHMGSLPPCRYVMWGAYQATKQRFPGLLLCFP